MPYTVEPPKHDISIKHVEMNCDGDLTTDLNPVLVNKNHIALFCGKSKSGKTNLAINLLTRPRVKGVRNSYKKVFDDILVVSPSMASAKDNVFADLAEEKKFTVLDEETLEFIESFTEANAAECRNTLVFLDDVGSALKTHTQHLSLLTQKHRHLRTTWWVVLQKYTNCPTSIRANASVMYLFRPISLKELDTIQEELLPIKKKDTQEFIDYVFDEKFKFLMIDMSLEKSAAPIYYKGFNKITFEPVN